MLALKELIVVLAIALTIFKLLKPLASSYTLQDDFGRRRNTWCAISIGAFLCPNFGIFCLVAFPILIWSGRRDSNPGALYIMLMYVVPAFSLRFPMVGSSYLVNLDFTLLLSFCVMAPAALRLRTAKRSAWKVMDVCLLLYLALTSVYFILPEIDRGVLMTPTFTDCLRRGFESYFEIYLPYLVLSRSSASRREIQDSFFAFCLSCAVMAAIGVFESSSHWLLYGEMRGNWGPDYNPYLMRAQSVRAMASTMHPLVLGYILAVAFGLWLSLKSNLKSKLSGNAIILLYWLGLLASYSRGPWIGAVIIYCIYVARSHWALSRQFKAIGSSLLVVLIVAISPLGNRVLQVIPYFGGTVDVENIDYRQRLLERAWQIVQDNPILGDRYAILKMQDLRQGQGIIDLMNGFMHILLNNGFVGLSLFLSFVIIGVIRAWKLSNEYSRVGVQLSAMGASLVACILGTMAMMWAGGLIVSTTCVLVGLAVACSDLSRKPQRELIG
jgi:O-Antigen ligase